MRKLYIAFKKTFVKFMINKEYEIYKTFCVVLETVLIKNK